MSPEKSLSVKSPGTTNTTSVKSSVGKVSESPSAKEKKIKYEDKSGGQPELIPIFNSIKALMKPYVKGTLKERGERPGLYNLISEKPIEVEGRKKDEVYFATILIQKGYVGFYFMPVYGCDKPNEIFHPDLLKHLKGKACFHIKKNAPEVLEQIKNALEEGYNLYKRRGWV